MPAEDQLYRGLISIKGVIWSGSTVVLVQNQRGEWELPGGKLHRGENFSDCLVRECREELGIGVVLGPLLGAAPHHYYADIVVLTFGCYSEPFVSLSRSDEHLATGQFRLDELMGLVLPDGYRDVIRAWAQDVRSTC